MPRTSTAPRTIECPKCHQQLPAWAEQCQFCKTQLFPGQVRRVDVSTYADRNKPTWTEAAYIVVSVIIVAQGLFMLLQAFNVIPSVFYAIGGGTFFGIFGSIQLLLGVGMLLHQTWAQFIMKWVCVLNIPGGLLGIVQMAFIHNPLTGATNYVGLCVSVLQLCFTCFALFVINKEGDLD